MTQPNDTNKAGASRRVFLKTSAVIAAGAAVASRLDILPRAYAEGKDEIRIGLIGCGGRGTGATMNAIQSSQNVKLVAMGDLFPDRLTGSQNELKKNSVTPPDADHCFTGFDAYQKVLALADVNYAILATPPGFRSLHLKAAVKAGKNVFAEKPVAVDGPTVRACLEAYQEALDKKLAVGVGTQRRHSFGYQETIKRIHDGAIGDIVSARAYWNQGGLWHHGREEKWTDMEWQIRNWLYFTWLSGDHICEQHVHNLDVINWVMNAHPKRALGLGGRQVRTDPKFGNVFDHFAIEYEYPNGARMASMCRQIDGCDGNVSEHVAGTKGVCSPIGGYAITGEQPWSFDKKKDCAHYVQEHADLIASIRAGQPINEMKNVAESTLTAIMGRMSTYTGKAVTWEEALNSTTVLMPQPMEFGALPAPVIAVPGQTKIV